MFYTNEQSDVVVSALCYFTRQVFENCKWGNLKKEICKLVYIAVKTYFAKENKVQLQTLNKKERLI